MQAARGADSLVTLTRAGGRRQHPTALAVPAINREFHCPQIGRPGWDLADRRQGHSVTASWAWAPVASPATCGAADSHSVP
jgi:hypothetical protein